jgi:hypothetical protein
VRQEAVGALVEPLGRDDLEPEGVGHPVDQVEEEADVEGVDHPGLAHARLEEPRHVIRSEVVGMKGHHLEEIERGMDPGVDGRRLPILEDRRRLFCSEALRRDRAVSSRSELASVAF